MHYLPVAGLVQVMLTKEHMLARSTARGACSPELMQKAMLVRPCDVQSSASAMSVWSQIAAATSGDQSKALQAQEIMVSRNPFRSSRPRQTNPQSANQGNSAHDAIIDQAHALFGSEAATAVAYCALSAWFEDEEVEYRRFAEIFRRLRN